MNYLHARCPCGGRVLKKTQGYVSLVIENNGTRVGNRRNTKLWRI